MKVKIKKAHKIALQGRINKGVYTCLECGFTPENYNVTPHIIGFNDFSPGLAWCIWKCPKCEQVQRFHADKTVRINLFNYILMYEEYKKGNKNWLQDSYSKAIKLRKHIEDDSNDT